MDIPAWCWKPDHYSSMLQCTIILTSQLESVFLWVSTLGVEVSCIINTFLRQSYQNGSLCFTGDVTIPAGITLTVLSDLNGPTPQFTLTCISTGGPATTVTWTRDSTTVTEGTETVLDDPVTAQYTHTLTVTGRLGGLYTCTVSNNKPSSASASITVTGNTLFSLIHSCNSLIWLAHLYTTSLSVPSHVPLSFFPLFFLHKILSSLSSQCWRQR